MARELLEYNRVMRCSVVLLALLLTGLTASAATAQQVDITAPAPTRDRPIEGILARLQYEITRRDDSHYLPPGRVCTTIRLHRALVVPTETGRRGLAAWTSPTAAMGGSVTVPRVIGYFAIGFAFEWGGRP